MTAPDPLFDLAVNRAATTLLGLGLLGSGLLGPGLHDASSQQAAAALAEWHARTRFAHRTELSQVIECLKRRPGDARGDWHWAGGLEGGWEAGRAAFP